MLGREGDERGKICSQFIPVNQFIFALKQNTQ